jgi:hypothetical protein
MNQIYNVYCDESCHLENDLHNVMVLGAVWCPLIRCRDINVSLREIKVRHGLSATFEVKWTKVSPAKHQFYLEWINYFFDNPDLHFRALIVPDKSKLCHKAFPKQNHDIWYYKMYYDMLKVIFSPQFHYRIYLDIKDTRGGAKIRKLKEILSYLSSQEIINRLQLIHSKEVELLQLADLMIGAVSYINRNQKGNKGKELLVKTMRNRSGCSLTHNTSYSARKVNILRWQAQEVKG